ncbi:Porin transmembrane protein [Cupriavidus taiwanensis]|uniref:Porin transmembrane protein n=1 Tax=Cupriavidus taiwanensis TaxID=164546 RepID=A0A375BHD3_9BURK|nr:porin [Cupriavidus taiwanensis]SOY44397.1 Porin transmembrane protein [Cupriavidus taiwanensis]
MRICRIQKLAAVALSCSVGTGTAVAQGSVQLYGTVDAFAGSVRFSGDVSSKVAVQSSGMTTSYWGIGGQEALGGGLNAEFALEGFFKTDDGQLGRFPGDTFLGRNAYVGLNGSFGAIKLGRNTTPWFISMMLFNPLTDSAAFSPIFLHTYNTLPGSPVNLTVAGDTEWDNSVLYQSPAFGGLRFNAMYSTGESMGHQGKQNYGANVTYFAGNFGATAAIQRVAVSAFEFIDSGAAYQVSYIGGLSYNFATFKLFAQYAQSDNHFDGQSTQHDRTTQLGTSLPLPAGALMLAWARTWHGGNETILAARRDTATLAYDYPFSKRTDAYAAWRYDKVTGFGPGNSFAVGLRHKF